MTPDELRALVARDPAETALLFDFDGVLAPIVADPAAARPVAGAVDLLAELATRFRRVAVVSGRPREFLAAHLPASVDLSGLYGLESRIAGRSHDHHDADRWRSVIAGVVDSAELTAGVVLEPKGLSLTAHYRQAPDAATAVGEWAADVATATGLIARPAKASVELHPPVPVDKGTVVAELAAGCATVTYAGDDIGDLPAFRALDRLRDQGRDTAKIVTSSAEVPRELLRVADLVLDGPAAVIDLFTGVG